MRCYRGHIVGRRGLASESAESRVTSLESCDTCPFRPTVATINLTIVKGRLIHATLLSIRYPLNRKRMDSCDLRPDPSSKHHYRGYSSYLSFCPTRFVTIVNSQARRNARGDATEI